MRLIAGAIECSRATPAGGSETSDSVPAEKLKRWQATASWAVERQRSSIVLLAILNFRRMDAWTAGRGDQESVDTSMGARGGATISDDAIALPVLMLLFGQRHSPAPEGDEHDRRR